MAARRATRLRRRHDDWETSDAPNGSVRPGPRLPSAAVAPVSAVLDGLDPGRLDVASRTATLARLGSTVGNAATAGFVARARTDYPLGPPDGVREIRRIGGTSTLGHTRSLIDPSPPVFRPRPAESINGRAAVRPSRTRLPEMDFEVRYPAPGPHLLYEGTTSSGQPARTWLDVSDDWSGTILRGEEEHVADQSIAWRDTWERIAGVINEMADAPPVCRATPEEATRAAWEQFVAALPAPLRPVGAEPTEAAQLDAWGFDQETSAFRVLVGESKRARDNGWHTTSAELDHMDGADEVRTVERGSSQIGETKPEDLMRAAWLRLPVRRRRG
jgi:hypothetical protein